MRTNRVGAIAVLLASITVSIAIVAATSFAQQAPRGAAPPAQDPAGRAGVPSQGPGGRGGARGQASGGRDGAPGQAPGGRGGGGGLGAKAPHLVASVWTVSSTVARTQLRHEWVDVPLGNGRLRTWVEYPEGEGRAPVVLVLQHEPGLDDWMRGVADQLALEGFIAVAPDLFSGFGPNGGGFDSFPAPDVAMRVAGPRLTPDEAMRRAVAAAEFGLKLPRASGAIGSLGVGSPG
ncbi:MAG: dienelactone hydrolase family protein, partial [Acidobacteria bacterium]|nr:dienelactone hydrolase family protein [Acidobacteriota bacterium]